MQGNEQRQVVGMRRRRPLNAPADDADGMVPLNAPVELGQEAKSPGPVPSGMVPLDTPGQVSTHTAEPVTAEEGSAPGAETIGLADADFVTLHGEHPGGKDVMPGCCNSCSVQ